MTNNAIMSVPETTLFVPEYQRPLRTGFAKNERSSFNELALGVLTVIPKENGQYAVIDGQHRLSLIREVKPGSLVKCNVVYGLTPSEEIELYKKLKTTKPPTETDMFLADLANGERKNVEIVKMVEEHGFVLEYRTGKPHRKAKTIHGVKAISVAYSSRNLETMLMVISRAWPEDPQGTNFSVMMGLNIAINKGKEHNMVASRLIESLEKTTPGALLNKASNRKDQLGGGVHTHLARLVIEQYNKGLRTNKIPLIESF